MEYNGNKNLLEEARLLMPWYLTNKLSAEQRSLVDEALAQYPSFQDELAREEHIKQLVHSNVSLLDLSAMETSQQRLDKLLRRIDKEIGAEQSQMAVTLPIPLATPKVQNKPVAERAWKAWVARVLDFEWLTPANAAFALLLLIQFGFVALYMGNGAKTDKIWGTVASVESNDGKASLTGGNSPIFLIRFNPNAEYSQVCSFLTQHSATIVEGPDDQNRFKIRVTNLQPNADIRATLNEMRADPNSPLEHVDGYFEQ